MGRRPVCVLCLLLIALLVLADWLGMPLIRGNPLPASFRAWMSEQSEISAIGEVEECVDTEFSQSVYLKEVSVFYKSEKISIGKMRVFLKKREVLPAGSLILVSGKPEEVAGPRNPGEFDSRQYYACRHIYYFMKNAVVRKKSRGYSHYGQFLISMRERFARILERASGKAAPVFEAVVLGDKSKLEMETKMRFQMAGIIHILAISGLHISVLGVGLYNLLKKAGLGIWPAGLLALVVMLQYGMMTGGSVSTMRAVIMFLLSVGAKILGRIYDMPTALSVAAILLLVESPAYLLDGGFWLSFGAVLGIGVTAPVLCDIFGVSYGHAVGKMLVSSLAVQVTTFPVILWSYGEVSVVGIFLNLLVLPTVGVVLASGVFTALTGIFWIPAAVVCALPGRGLLFLYDFLGKMAGKMPFGTWIGGKPVWWQISGYYLVFGAALAAGRWLVRIGESSRQQSKGQEKCMDWRRQGRLVLRKLRKSAAQKNSEGREDRRRKGWEVKGFRKKVKGAERWCARGMFVVWLCLGMLFLTWHSTPGLRITCLDIGQGDAIVVETPVRQTFLIDGGSSNKKGIAQHQILPYLKSRGISYVDAIFISHTDGDHISGIQELLEYRVQGLTSVGIGGLVLPDWREPPKEWKLLETLAKKAGIPVLRARAGKVFRAGRDEVEFCVLSPAEGASGEDVNEDAMVLELRYGEFRALFTGDMGMETERKLLKEGVLEDVDYLKVGHHGSKNSSSTEFLQQIKPELAVISVSAANTYGHPASETLKRLAEAGAKVLCTKDCGAVTAEIQDGKLRVSQFCGKQTLAKIEMLC